MDDLKMKMDKLKIKLIFKSISAVIDIVIVITAVLIGNVGIIITWLVMSLAFGFWDHINEKISEEKDKQIEQLTESNKHMFNAIKKHNLVVYINNN